MPTASNRLIEASNRSQACYLLSYSAQGRHSRKMVQLREFPDGSVVRTLHFYCEGPGSIPG